MTIAPLATATQNVAVAGPAEPVTVGPLTIYGNHPFNASLTLSGSGPLSAASVSVLSGGAPADDGGVGLGSLATPTLAISGGSVALGNASTSVGTVTITGGTLNLSGGSIGSAAIGSGLFSAYRWQRGGATASGGNATITVPATSARRNRQRHGRGELEQHEHHERPDSLRRHGQHQPQHHYHGASERRHFQSPELDDQRLYASFRHDDLRHLCDGRHR